MEEGAGSAAGPAEAPSRAARGAPRTRTHTHSRDSSDSSRACGARGQPPGSAPVSGSAGGSGVSEAPALPQSPPCNPDPRERERERERGGASRRHAPHVTGSLHGFPPPPPPRASARAGISNARDWARRGRPESRGPVGRLGGPGRGLAGRRRTSLLLRSGPNTKARSAKLLRPVYCAATTCRALGNQQEQALVPVPRMGREQGWA